MIRAQAPSAYQQKRQEKALIKMGKSKPVVAKPRPNPVERIPRAMPRLSLPNHLWTAVITGVHMAEAPAPARAKEMLAVQKDSTVPIRRVPIPKRMQKKVMTLRAPKRSVRVPVRGVRQR
jgi:hypothetical protein